MVPIRVEQDVVRFGERFSVSFQRTLRIPNDGKSYPMPPGLGTFPIDQVAAFADRLPDDWRQPNALFLPSCFRGSLGSSAARRPVGLSRLPRSALA
jgi:hypothetical protein